MRLYLPRSKSDTVTVALESKNIELPHGEETVLVVDDEPDLLQLANQFLLELGYRTYTAENASQAMDILNSDAHIDLLFSDIVMQGGVNGYQLAQQAKQLQPDLRLLSSSGFASRSIIGSGDESYANLVLNKPYRKIDLAQRVRWVLDDYAGKEQ